MPGVSLRLESLPSKCVQRNARNEHNVALVLEMQRWPQLKSIVNKRIQSATPGTNAPSLLTLKIHAEHMLAEQA